MDISLIRELNQQTGCGLTTAKKSLLAANGDYQKALQEVSQQLNLKVAKRADRPAAAGFISSYVHNGRIGVLVEVNCETSFGAKSDQLLDFGKNIAIQVAASDEEVTEADNQLEALLSQEYVKAPEQTVADYQKQVSSQIGEKIVIRRFVRYDLSSISD